MLGFETSNAGTAAQFLAFFDVDMEPKADFLQRIMPLFYQYDVDKEAWLPDWKVGRVTLTSCVTSVSVDVAFWSAQKHNRCLSLHISHVLL